MDPISTRLRQWADRNRADTEHLLSLRRESPPTPPAVAWPI